MRFATRATEYTQLSGKHPFILTVAAPTRLVVHLPVHAVCKQVGGRHPQRPRDGQAQLPEAAAAGEEACCIKLRTAGRTVRPGPVAHSWMPMLLCKQWQAHFPPATKADPYRLEARLQACTHTQSVMTPTGPKEPIT